MPSQFRAHPGPVRRARSAQPLADLVMPCLTPALARQGFGEADVLMHWPEIVGEALAEHCRPVKLQWRPRLAGNPDAGPGEPATLVVRVVGVFALTLQHMAPVVIERINVYFGWRCVGKLVLKQGPLPPRTAKRTRPAEPDAVARERALGLARDVGDDALRAALVRLGGEVLRRRRDPEAEVRDVPRTPFG